MEVEGAAEWKKEKAANNSVDMQYWAE